MSSSPHPLPDVRGTIIICDRTYQSPSGQWVVAGTLSYWWTEGKVVTFDSSQLHAYIRFQVDKPGTYNVRFFMIDRTAASHDKPLFEGRFSATISDPNAPYEMGLPLPGMVVNCPADPTPDHPVGISLKLWLQVGQHDVASTPFAVIFKAKA